MQSSHSRMASSTGVVPFNAQRDRQDVGDAVDACDDGSALMHARGVGWRVGPVSDVAEQDGVRELGPREAERVRGLLEDDDRLVELLHRRVDVQVAARDAGTIDSMRARALDRGFPAAPGLLARRFRAGATHGRARPKPFSARPRPHSSSSRSGSPSSRSAAARSRRFAAAAWSNARSARWPARPSRADASRDQASRSCPGVESRAARSRCAPTSSSPSPARVEPAREALVHRGPPGAAIAP